MPTFAESSIEFADRLSRDLGELALDRPLPSNILTCRTDTWTNGSDGPPSPRSESRIRQSVEHYFGHEPVLVGKCFAVITNPNDHNPARAKPYSLRLFGAVALLFSDTHRQDDAAVGSELIIAFSLRTASITNTDASNGLRIFVGFRGDDELRGIAADEFRQAVEAVGGTHQLPDHSVVVLQVPEDASAVSFRGKVRKAGGSTESVAVAPFADVALRFPTPRYSSFPTSDGTAPPDDITYPVQHAGCSDGFHGHVDVARTRAASTSVAVWRLPESRMPHIQSPEGTDAPATVKAALLLSLSRHPFAAPLVGCWVSRDSHPIQVTCTAPISRRDVPLNSIFPLGPNGATTLCSAATITAIAAQLTLVIGHAHARGIVLGPLFPDRVVLHRQTRDSQFVGDNLPVMQWGTIRVKGVGEVPAGRWSDSRKAFGRLCFLSPQYIRQWHVDRPSQAHPTWQAVDDWWSLGALLFWLRTGRSLVLGTPINATWSRRDAATSIVTSAMADGRAVESAISEALERGAEGAPLCADWAELLFPASLPRAGQQRGAPKPHTRTKHVGLSNFKSLTVAEAQLVRTLCGVTTSRDSVGRVDVSLVAASLIFRDAHVAFRSVFSGAWPVPVVVGRLQARERAPVPAEPLATPPRRHSRSRSPRARVLLASIAPAVGSPTPAAVSHSRSAIEDWLNH
jgi:hypothetical protein